MSALRVTIFLSLVGCAAPPARLRAPTAEPASPVVVVAPSSRPSDAPTNRPRPAGKPLGSDRSALQRGLDLLESGDYRAADPLLRGEIASGPDFSLAAQALAGFYRRREDYPEAEAILQAGLGRNPKSLQLNFLRARVCAETNRWQKAAEILRAMAPAHPENSTLNLALVDAERALGHLDAAASLLDQVLHGPITDPEIESNIEQLEVLAEDLAEERRQGHRMSRTANELFAELRSGESPAVRRKAFKRLATRASTRPRAVFTAYQQPDPLLRVMAVRAWPVEGMTDKDLADLARNVRILFADPDPRVRAAASGLARNLPRNQAAELLLSAMEKEQDGYAFRTIYADLSMILNSRQSLSPGAEDDPEARARIVQHWRQTWQR